MFIRFGECLSKMYNSQKIDNNLDTGCHQIQSQNYKTFPKVECHIFDMVITNMLSLVKSGPENVLYIDDLGSILKKKHREKERKKEREKGRIHVDITFVY